MKKILLIIGMSCSAFAKTYAQTVKFSSNVSRVETRKTESDTFTKQDYAIYHLVVYDIKNKKINTYHESNKDTDLDVVSTKKEIVRSITTYTSECVDDENLQCKAILTYIDGKPLFLRIEYSLLRLTFFLD